MNQNSTFHVEEFNDYKKSVPKALDAIGAEKIFARLDKILLKPNLVNASAFPVTTSPEFCRAVIKYIKKSSNAKIIIAEGCGDAFYETDEIFSLLGYERLADEFGLELIDLNTAELIEVSNPKNTIFPTMLLPGIAINTYLFSLPVLKAHSLADITGTLKNMMGIVPPEFYSGNGGWKKAVFHEQMQQSIVELNRFRIPDLTLMDASVGLSQYHLGGQTCQPHVNKLIVSDNPWLTDQYAAELLGLNSKKIFHLNSK